MNRVARPIAVLFAVSFIGTAAVASEEIRPQEPLRPVYFRKVEIDGFWKTHFKRLSEQWIPHCIEQIEAGGQGRELMNLVYTAQALAGQPTGKFTGCPWSDAYVYNTVESMCLALAIDPAGDEDLAEAQRHLRAKMEEWIPIILAAQCDDGYIHSFHVVNGHPRYSNIGWHEFYVQGYFLEMGVAHFRITGGSDRRLYDAAVRCADRLCETFGPPPKRVWIHGHAGMGLALCRLARLVNEVEGPGKGERYFQLAKFLFDTRHTVDEHRSPYHQSHRPVVEMTDAVGHAVRATYFYTAMADLAMLTGDGRFQTAVDRVWTSAIDRKHYITGGVGASHRGEAFSDDFDLRNDGYCESCAGCGITFWADRMHRVHRHARHIDVQERTLYNNILGAVELSGRNFFYQNPLASDKARYSWHGCPCCVGNIPRALLGIKDLTYAVDDANNTLFVSHFVAGAGTIARFAGTSLRIGQETGYPWSGDVKIRLAPAQSAEFTLKIRIPDRTESELYSATPRRDPNSAILVNGKAQSAPVENGYASLHRVWQSGDIVELTLPMHVQRVHCDERVRANRGRVALIRGPVVYNVENVDHEGDVRDLVLPRDSTLADVWKPDLLGGVMAVEAPAVLHADSGPRPTRLLAVPNFARLNRGGYSQVWITEDPDKTVAPDVPPPPVIKPIVRAELDRRTTDRVVIGNPESERRHNLQGAATTAGVFRNMLWRHAGNGWFSYELAVRGDAENVVLCTYWGSDVGNRRFDVLVDGKKIGRQQLDRNEPGKFFDVEYAIPDELTRDKKKVTVRIQADAGATAGGVFDLRIVRPDDGSDTQ